VSGMSKEFIMWLVANGFCSGGGDIDNGCAHGHAECSWDGCDTGCSIATMWPMIQELDDGTIEIECIRPQQETYGPPFTIMVRKPYKVLMSNDMREAYAREWTQHQEVTKLKVRIQELEEHVRMRFGLCANKEDHEPHPVKTGSLAPYWCCANQCAREPYASEQRRKVQENAA